MKRANKVVSDSPGLVDFTIGLVNSVFDLPTGKWYFFRNSNNRKTVKSILLVKKLLRLVEMTSGLVDASFSLPEWPAVKMISFAPWYGLLTSHFQLLHKPLRTWVWLSTTRLAFQWTGSSPLGYPEMELFWDLHCTTVKVAPLVKRTLPLFTMEQFFLQRSRDLGNLRDTNSKCPHSLALGTDREALLWRREQVKIVRHVQSL